MNDISIQNRMQMRRVEMAAGLEKQILRHAWIMVSRKRPLTAKVLELYENELVWDEVSQNCEVEWSIEMAFRWKSKLNWMLFSRIARGQVVIPEGIEVLANEWDWKGLTVNPNVLMTVKLGERYASKWDWSAMAWRSWEGVDARGFYAHFIERIPVTAFDGSKLHFEIRRQEVERLWQKINEQ